MSDWPNVLLPPLNIVTPWSMESANAGAAVASTTPVSDNVYIQNQDYYYPFELDVCATAFKMFIMNGITINGNIDLGIYDAEWNKVVTLGATAQAGATAIQEGNITDTDLLPGQYWMGFSGSSATGSIWSLAAGTDENILPQAACYTQATAHPLPTTTATPVKSADATPDIIVMGVAFSTLI
jgi:hypothetical protein